MFFTISPKNKTPTRNQTNKIFKLFDIIHTKYDILKLIKFIDNKINNISIQKIFTHKHNSDDEYVIICDIVEVEKTVDDDNIYGGNAENKKVNVIKKIINKLSENNKNKYNDIDIIKNVKNIKNIMTKQFGGGDEKFLLIIIKEKNHQNLVEKTKYETTLLEANPNIKIKNLKNKKLIFIKYDDYSEFVYSKFDNLKIDLCFSNFYYYIFFKINNEYLELSHFYGVANREEIFTFDNVAATNKKYTINQINNDTLRITDIKTSNFFDFISPDNIKSFKINKDNNDKIIILSKSNVRIFIIDNWFNNELYQNSKLEKKTSKLEDEKIKTSIEDEISKKIDKDIEEIIKNI
jgi:hypothetical protein